MKTTLSIIAAALVSGAAYGQLVAPPHEGPEDELDKIVCDYNQTMEEIHTDHQRWLEQRERDDREEQAQAERERQTELMEEMLDAIQDLDR